MSCSGHSLCIKVDLPPIFLISSEALGNPGLNLFQFAMMNLKSKKFHANFSNFPFRSCHYTKNKMPNHAGKGLDSEIFVSLPSYFCSHICFMILILKKNVFPTMLTSNSSGFLIYEHIYNGQLLLHVCDVSNYPHP